MREHLVTTSQKPQMCRAFDIFLVVLSFLSGGFAQNARTTPPIIVARVAPTALPLTTSTPTAPLGNTTVSFDVPGAADTYSFSINQRGQVTGFYFDGSNNHGFLRNPNSTFISFDPAGSVDTEGESINKSGAIAGSYLDASLSGHGFIRDALGNITSFVAPNGDWALPISISDGGAIAGRTYPGQHGFVRDRAGNITMFDPAGSVQTNVASISQDGHIAGYYFLSSSSASGYVRDQVGNITTFDVPGASNGTFVMGMNPSATEIVGFYADSSSVYHADRLLTVTDAQSPTAGSTPEVPSRMATG